MNNTIHNWSLILPPSSFILWFAPSGSPSALNSLMLNEDSSTDLLVTIRRSLIATCESALLEVRLHFLMGLRL